MIRSALLQNYICLTVLAAKESYCQKKSKGKLASRDEMSLCFFHLGHPQATFWFVCPPKETLYHLIRHGSDRISETSMATFILESGQDTVQYFENYTENKSCGSHCHSKISISNTIQERQRCKICIQLQPNLQHHTRLCMKKPAW
jgi:hypothetical protein